MTRLTTEIEAEILHCYTHHGWSIHRIAKYLDANPSTIHNTLRRRHIKLRPRGRPRTINHTLAQELATRTRSKSTAARILDCHRTSLYYTPKP